MDRRLFLTGLLGVGTTAAIASVLPRQAAALPGLSSGAQVSEILPELDTGPHIEVPDGDPDEGVQLAWHEGKEHRRRRRRRRRQERRYRRQCRRSWYNGSWRRRCRRVPYWAWVWFWI